MIFIWLVLCYICVFYLQEFLNRRKCPPGPWPIPILGTLLHIQKAAKLPNIALANIASQYGSEITRHKMGSQETVVLSSYEAISSVLTNPDTFSRPLVGLLSDRSDGKRLGFVSKEGKSWEKRRNWSVRTLRDFGFGKSQALETMTSEIVDEFLSNMARRFPSDEGVFDIEMVFNSSVSKTMWKMLVGRCTTEDDKVIARLVGKNDKMLKTGTFGAGIMSVFPFVKYIAPEWSGYNAQMDFAIDTRTSAKKLLREIGSAIQESNRKAENFTEAYALKMVEDPEDFHEEDFGVLFMDLLQGASDTTSSFLEACMLFLILNPDIQRKVYKEVEENIPNGQPPVFSDLKRMIYTQAFFLEVHRCTKVFQLLVPRRAMKDFYYKKYLIKKDTQILIDCQTAFNDQRFGNDPHVFRPERFMGENGELGESHKYFVPFSIGKRNCPGENLAELTSFLFFVNILKNYELSTVPGKSPPTAEMNVGFTSRPFPFQMWVKKRSSLN